MALPISRTNHVELVLDKVDTAILKLDGNEVQIKYMEGRWSIFCNEKVEVVQVNPSPTLTTEHSF